MLDGFRSFNLIDKNFIAQIFPQKYTGEVLYRDSCLGCDASQSTEAFRPVDGILNRTQKAGGTNQKDGLCGFRRDYGFMGKMGFQRQAAGAVSFNQDIVCQSR